MSCFRWFEIRTNIPTLLIESLFLYTLTESARPGLVAETRILGM